MSKLIESIKSPHIQIALVTGLSILFLAYASKRVSAEPIGYLQMAIPPFLATIYSAVLKKHKGKKICTTWYWIVAIIIATALVIVLNMI
ncbi:MAG: hypothetical protein KOO63_09650 [Bacteroidales bacterium]|nr:hypothetical protein [Candidatus Latescibacterota bacterium]